MIRTIKTKQFKITALVLALVLTVSCVMMNATKVHAQELEINNANVQTFSGAGITDDGKLVGTSDTYATMRVFITSRSPETKYQATNAKWEHNGTSWVSETTVLYEGTGSTQQIYACAPYAADAADGVIPVNASEQIDWLVATATDLTSSDVNLTMTHAMAKLVLVPTFGTEVENTGIAEIEVGNMYASGDLSITDNSWSNLSDANTILVMENSELLVIPMAQCTSFPVTITMEDGRVFTTTVSLATVDNKLEAGTQYNIALQVGQDKVTLGSITAEKWSQADGGVLETE